MDNLLKYSSFQSVLFPAVDNQSQQDDLLTLRKAMRFCPRPERSWREMDMVVFDLETTGLNDNFDRVIEVGAQKLRNFKVVDEFSTLVNCPIPLSKTVEKLTGINNEMLKNQPAIEDVLPKFLEFIDQTILFAHNAAFDIGFIKAEAVRQNLEVEWPTFCSLKMARKLLPDLESRSLDTLAEHYGLNFEARHRSIGDVKVTVAVLERLLLEEARNCKNLADLGNFSV